MSGILFFDFRLIAHQVNADHAFRLQPGRKILPVKAAIAVDKCRKECSWHVCVRVHLTSDNKSMRKKGFPLVAKCSQTQEEEKR